MRTLFYKSYLALYRIGAAIMLYGMLVALAAYGSFYAFYAVNTSWVAPVLISPSNDKILAMTAQLVASQQEVDTLTVTNNNLILTRSEMIQQKAALQDLDAKLEAAIEREKRDNSVSGRELAALAHQKRADLIRTRQVLDDADQLKISIERDLRAGLITRSEAFAQETALTQMKNQYTDSKVSQVLLEDNVREKFATDLTATGALAKLVELIGEINQLSLNIATGDQQIRNNTEQIAHIQKAIATTQDNPYYLATASNQALPFAFVPYDNQKAVAAGVPVYDCYLNMIVCRQVGTVKKIFTDEENASNPIYKTDIRGFLIQLDLINTESAKSKTLFLNRKPLLL